MHSLKRTNKKNSCISI